MSELNRHQCPVCSVFCKSKSLVTKPKEDKQELVTVYETIEESINLKELNDLELEKYIKMLDNLMTNPTSDL